MMVFFSALRTSGPGTFRPKALTAIFAIFAFSAVSWGESFIPSAVPFSTLAAEDGLSNDSVYCMLQDSRGFVWIGTFGGLDRYDGKETVSFKPGGPAGTSLSASVIFALAEGTDGAVWAGTDGGGLNRVDPLSGAVSVFRGADGAERGPGSDLVYALAADVGGNLWVGTGGCGLAYRDQRTGAFRHFTRADGIAEEVVRALLLDGGGRLWVGTAGGGLVVSDAPSSASPRFVPVSLPGAENATIRSLHEDPLGRVWIGTEGRGLFVAENRSAAAHPVALPLRSGGSKAIVRAIGSDSAGRIWVGTEGEGVVVLLGDGSSPMELRAEERHSGGLSGDQIRSILRDRSGLLWIGTKDQGISIGNPSAPTFGLRRAGASGSLPRGTIRGFADAGDGTLWLASDGGGLLSFDPETNRYRAYAAADGLQSSRVCSVFRARDGTVFAGTDGAGLFRLDPRTRRLASIPLGLTGDQGASSDTGAVAWTVSEDSRGSVWVGLEGEGLIELRRDGSRRRFRYGPAGSSALPGRSVRCLLEDTDGSLLVGTWDGGLVRIDPASGELDRYAAASGEYSTSDVSIYCIVRDSAGRTWVGTGAGLDRLERSSDGADRVMRTYLGPLPRTPSVFGIAEDSFGRLWLSTEMGLLRYDPADGSLRTWTSADGLQDDHFSPGSYIRLPDGQVAFGGPEGLNLFRPLSGGAAESAPQVRIVSILPLDGQGVPNRSASMPGDGSLIRVPYATSGFSLKIAVLDFTDPDKNLYAVRLEGSSDQRYYLGLSNTAIVPRLAPGRYRFVAAGAGNRGVWNESGSSVTVEVVPPFWSGPLFLAAVSSLIAVGVFGGVRLRVSRLEHRTRELRDLSAHVHEAREAERTEIAREVHDELGQTLTALKMGLYWAKENSRISAESMESRLGELLEYTDLALDSVKSISTRLRPKVLDTLPLGEAMDWLVRDFSRWSGVECRTKFDPTPVDPDPRIKTTLFRVLQEILTNVARHSGASSVSIFLTASEEFYELRVRDDGTGIDPEKPNAERSFGIAGMRERCAYLGGSFEIAPAPGGGTVVIARIPVGAPTEENDA